MLIDDNLLMCLDFKIPHKQLGRRIECEVSLNYLETLSQIAKTQASFHCPTYSNWIVLLNNWQDGFEFALVSLIFFPIEQISNS